MNKKQETIDTYNKNAHAMADKFDAIGVRIDDVNRMFSYIKKEKPFIVEIGCGNGRDAKEICEHDCKYLGIDVSNELIKLAQNNLPNGVFKVSDLETFEFPKHIDCVFAMASLLHSNKEKIEHLFKKVHNALNKKGIIYISLKKGKYEKEGLTRKDEFGTRTYFHYTPSIIEKLATDAFKTIYTHEQELNKQKWFTIVLQKR